MNIYIRIYFFLYILISTYVYLYGHICVYVYTYVYTHTNVWVIEYTLGSSLNYSEPGTCLCFPQGIDPYISNSLSNPAPFTSRGYFWGWESWRLQVYPTLGSSGPSSKLGCLQC